MAPPSQARSSHVEKASSYKLFRQGDAFVQKITGNPNVDRPNPKVFVTVDMLSTRACRQRVYSVPYSQLVMQNFLLNSIDGLPLEAAAHRCSGLSLGTVVQVHGITATMDEGGMFVRLAERLCAAGFDVLRFSFRGHGKSGGTQRGVTIAGEMLDLQAAIDHATKQLTTPIYVVAASFGAVSTCLSLPFIEHRLRGLALWNPVLDLKRTFVSPELPWAKQSFNHQGVRELALRGFLLLDQTFEIGRVLYEEMRQLNPIPYFVGSNLASMIAHGDKDSSVSYDIAMSASQGKPNCDFYTVVGSDHGFDGRDKEDEAISRTVSWLRENSKRCS